MKQKILFNIKDIALHTMLYHLFANKGYVLQDIKDFSKGNLIKDIDLIYIVDYPVYEEHKNDIASLINANEVKFICLLPNNLKLNIEPEIQNKIDFYNIPSTLKALIDLF